MVSLRNLFRQKRRNILLGIAMAFGVMILIIANSFSAGISDIMFNKIVKYVSGHASININEGAGYFTQMFRDRERLEKIIKQNIQYIEDYDEGIGVFLRAVGNGKSDNMVLVGIDVSKTLTEKQRKEVDESFRMIEGKFEDLRTTETANPVIISKEKAAVLSVKRKDSINIRYRNVYGQDQSARLTVIGIMSNDNIFMQGVMFSKLADVKNIMGYKPHETANIVFEVTNPRENAVKVADNMHRGLTPGQAFIFAKASSSSVSDATVLPFMGEDESKKLISDNFKLSSGKMEDVLSKGGLMISDELARKIGAAVGQQIEFTFKPKFHEENYSFKGTVRGIFRSDESTGRLTVYMHEALFYKNYYNNLPDQAAVIQNAFLPKGDAAFHSALGKEWVLLERTRTTDDWKKKIQAATKKKMKVATVDVNSMYESASDVLKLEGALNLITLSAVLILFFIILIGVINTLRMTIRERTREIGTMRAIGMQRRDVMSIFILETGFLTLFASLAGAALAFIVMGILSLIPFSMSDNPMGMLLVNQRLHFLPTFAGVIGNIFLIIFISVVTAFFPARRAANLSAAEALRHYE